MSFPINPTLINFNHKKGQSLPVSQTINFTSLADYVSYDNLPSWLTITAITSTNLKINLNNNVNNLTAGNHNAAVEINDNYDFEPRIRWSDLQVNLSLTDTIFLNVAPASGLFNFTIGGSEPTSKLFSITSENNWNITKNANWLALSTTSGAGTGSFNVIVTATGLTAGTYNDTITVDDGVDAFDISISLVVSNPDTGAVYLYTQPNQLKFGYTLSGIIPPAKTIDINASGAFAIAATENWINLSAITGVVGTSFLSITMQNVSGFAVGLHIGYVDITLGSIVKRVVIELSVYAFITEMLTPGTLYFTDNENNIKVSSGRLATNLSINVTANYKSVFYALTYNIPFIKGVAAKRIGAEASKMIGVSDVFGTSTIYAFTPYQAVVLNMLINEIDLYTAQVVQSVSLVGIKMIKGIKPPTNLLSNIPNTVFLTTKGVLVFSVLSNGNPIGDIVITGDVTLTNSPSISTNDFYTVVIALSEMPTLIVGNEINIAVLDQSIKVVIVSDQVDHSIIMFETIWNTLEAVECTGEIIKTIKGKQQNFVFRKDHLQKETKVISSEIITSYSIDTGYIMSKSMVPILESLINAANIWLLIDGKTIKVRSLTRNLKLNQTLRESTSFNLTFEDNIIK